MTVFRLCDGSPAVLTGTYLFLGRCFQHGSDPWLKKVGNSLPQSAGCYPQRCVPGTGGAPPALYVEVAPGSWLQCVDNAVRIWTQSAFSLGIRTYLRSNLLNLCCYIPCCSFKYVGCLLAVRHPSTKW